MLSVIRVILFVFVLVHCSILFAQIRSGDFIFAIANDGSLFTHNDTISSKDAAGLISIHALYIGKEKIYKLKIKEFQMTIIRDNAPDISFKGSSEILTSEMKSFLKTVHPKEIIPIAFEGIFTEYDEPGELFKVRKGVSLMRLHLINR